MFHFSTLIFLLISSIFITSKPTSKTQNSTSSQNTTNTEDLSNKTIIDSKTVKKLSKYDIINYANGKVVLCFVLLNPKNFTHKLFLEDFNKFAFNNRNISNKTYYFGFVDAKED